MTITYTVYSVANHPTTENPTQQNYDILNPVGVDNDTTTRQITIFQAPPTVDEAKAENLHKQKSHTHLNQSLVNFLERPQLTGFVLWGTTVNRGSPLMWFDPLREILSRPQYANKLRGFQFFKASAKVRFQVTGNAFLSGKVRAVWVPRNRSSVMASHICTPTMITGIKQGVDIYPTENGTYELDIPMLWPAEWFNVDDLGISWTGFDPRLITNGYVVLYVLSPLVTEDNTDTCAITAYSLLTNIELADVYSANDVPTVDPIVSPAPTSLLWYNMGSTGYPAVTDIVDHLTDPIPPAPPMFFNDSETRVGPNNAEAQKATESGTLSSYAATVSSLASALTPFVPSFAPLTMAISATAGGLSSIFSFFKLDKPVVEQLPIQIQSRWKDLTHTDGGDTTSKLSVLSSNSICPVGMHQPFSESDLSISSICSIPQLIYSRSVTTATGPGYRVCNWVVCPSNVCIQPVSQPDFYHLFQTNAAFIASAFEYWRGDCVFTIEVVAQAFSKMALCVSWFPSITSPPYTNQTASVYDGTYATTYSKIINVSGNTKATFKVPYLTQNYACSTNYLVKSFNGMLGSSNEQFFNGYITISVVNPLTNFSPTSPDNNSVDILLYQHWENLSFYKPCSYKMSNLRGDLYPRISDWVTEGVEEEMNYNSAEVDPGDNFNCDALNPSQFFGESSDSILDLIRRPSYFGGITADVTNTLGTVMSTAFSFFFSPNLVAPSASNERWNTNIPNNAQPASFAGAPASFMAYFSSLFLTARGDVTYNLVTPSMGDPSVSVDEYPVLLANCMIGQVPSEDYTSVLPTVSHYGSVQSYFGGGSYYRPAGNSQNPSCVTIPFYTPSNFSFTVDTLTPPGSGSIVRYWDRGRMPGVQILSKGSTSVPSTEYYDFLISAADNFSFGGYYPVPAINYAITSKSIGGVHVVHE